MAPVEGGRFDEAALSLGAEAVAIVADGQHVAVVQRAASHPTTRPAFQRRFITNRYGSSVTVVTARSATSPYLPGYNKGRTQYVKGAGISGEGQAARGARQEGSRHR